MTPAAAGESPHVTFRATGLLGPQLQERRTWPDVRNDPLSKPRGSKEGDLPALGAVAARDLIVFHKLLEAELADAAAELTRDQAVVIVDAVGGLITDFTWITNAPSMLASEIEDFVGDDDDETDDQNAKLAEMIEEWPRLRAFAVLEAAIVARGRAKDCEDFDTLLVEVGLQRPPRRARAAR